MLSANADSDQADSRFLKVREMVVKTKKETISLLKREWKREEKPGANLGNITFCLKKMRK